jgi:hypothetical protein
VGASPDAQFNLEAVGLASKGRGTAGDVSGRNNTFNEMGILFSVLSAGDNFSLSY